MSSQPIEILLIEDDPGDVDLIRETMAFSKIFTNFTVVDDGEKAISYVHEIDEKGPSMRAPDLILLDLHLPKRDGREVLKEIRASQSLKRTPVVVLTTEENEQVVKEVYALGANCFVTKPMGLDQFSLIIKSIEDFWFTIVKLPKDS